MSDFDIINSILDRTTRKQASSVVDATRAKVPETPNKPADDWDPDEGEEFVPVGLDGLLSATEKLLAVNRGLENTDERDSLQFKRVMTTDKLLGETIKLDGTKTRRAMMPNLARQRSLKSLTPFVFDSYSERLLLGNPLSTPLEEINPMHLIEQSRRLTQMGPGGIGSENAITEDMQAIHPSQFGFLSTLEGPECFTQSCEVFTLRGWTPWPEVTDADIFACRVDDVLEWHPASRIVRQPYSGPILVAENATMRMAITPNHRVLFSWDGDAYKVAQAAQVYGKSIKLPIRHEPEVGSPTFTTFELPPVEGGDALKHFGSFDLGDFCEYVGWFLSEGNTHDGMVNITQCPKANPDKHARLVNLHKRMQLVGPSFSGTSSKFSVGAKQFVAYFERYQGHGCYNKWIPEELFQAPASCRQRLLEGLLLGDGRWNNKRMCYCSVSKKLSEDVLRLAISLGYTGFIREEKDTRDHVNTTNYVVAIHRQKHRQPMPAQWSTVKYNGMVYCATVPGGFLHVRGKTSTSGYWSGNSEKIGIDTRAAWGSKIGSDGKIYQRFYDRRKGRYRWMSPEDLDGLVVKLPE